MALETQGDTSSKMRPCCSVGQDFSRAVPPLRASATGILHGAKVITTRGVRLVQDLRARDLIITRANGVVPIEWIERQSLIARAVYVVAGSIGHRNKERDTILPADHPVLVRDWRARVFGKRTETLIRAKHLVDGEYVRDIGLQTMTVYRIQCATPQVIYADGMELGTVGVSTIKCLEC